VNKTKTCDNQPGTEDSQNGGLNGADMAKKTKKKKKKKKAAASADNQTTRPAAKIAGAAIASGGGVAVKDETAAPGSAKKKRRKKKNKPNGGPAANVAALANFFQSSAQRQDAPKHTTPKPKAQVPTVKQYTDERLKAYGINPNQYNRMLKKQKYRDMEKKKT
jgi:hypothetical protein